MARTTPTAPADGLEPVRVAQRPASRQHNRPDSVHDRGHPPRGDDCAPNGHVERTGPRRALTASPRRRRRTRPISRLTRNGIAPAPWSRTRPNPASANPASDGLRRESERQSVQAGPDVARGADGRLSPPWLSPARLWPRGGAITDPRSKARNLARGRPNDSVWAGKISSSCLRSWGRGGGGRGCRIDLGRRTGRHTLCT